MKQLLFFFITINSFLIHSQVSSVILDSISNKEIQYVNIWVEDENIITISDKDGSFLFNQIDKNSKKHIILSSLDYEIKKIKISNLKDTVHLNPKKTILKKEILANKKEKKKLVVGRFKKSKNMFYYGSNLLPWMVGRYFPYEERFKNTPFLKTIEIHTESKIDSAKFSVRIFKKGYNIEPKEALHDSKIIAIAKKGNLLTKIDVSNLDIVIPKEGIVIVLEWFIIEPHKRVETIFLREKNEHIDIIRYEPMIGTLTVEKDENSLIYSKGKWINSLKPSKNQTNKSSGKYFITSMKLTLTN